MKFELGKYYYVHFAYGPHPFMCIGVSLPDGEKAVMQYVDHDGELLDIRVNVPTTYSKVYGEIPPQYVPGYKPPRTSWWQWLFG